MIYQYIFSIFVISSLTSAADPLRGINSFSSKLYDVLPRKNTNLIFSPFSAHAALTLASEAAAGETASILQRVLDLPGANETSSAYKDLMSDVKAIQKVNIEIANKIYVKSGYNLNEAFKSTAQNFYAAEAQNIDFNQRSAAADEINGWVKAKTNNKIDQLVSPNDFDELTAAVLLNAIYFKGNWLSRFEKQLTKKRQFYTTETDTTDCDTMYQLGDFEYGEDATLDAKILKMKYKDERFAMVVVLPNSKTGVESLERSLHSVDVTSLSLQKQNVEILLPKFKIESVLQLNEPLKQIGLANIFNDNANFSNMLDTDKEIHVDKVVQKAFIEVNEEGAEAAAATAVIFAFRSARYEPPIQPKKFHADHPFLFYITAELGQGNGNNKILFMGKVENPTT